MKISQPAFNSQSGQEYIEEMAIFNFQRAITPKVGKYLKLYQSYGVDTNVRGADGWSDGQRRTDGHSKFRRV